MKNRPQRLLQPTTLPGSPECSALAKWEPQTPSPLAKAELSRVIGDLSAKLTPATPEQYIREMAKLIEFVSAFGIQCPEPQAVQKIYREALALLPADLLTMAMARLRCSWTWGNRMPFPAEILKFVKEEFSARQVLLAKAKIALLKATETTAKKNTITPEQWAQLRRSIKLPGQGHTESCLPGGQGSAWDRGEEKNVEPSAGDEEGHQAALKTRSRGMSNKQQCCNNAEHEPDDGWELAIQNYDLFGIWPKKYGPKPDEPGCRAPAEFLKNT